MRIDRLELLAVVRELEPVAYGIPIYNRICQKAGPSRLLRIPATWRVSMGHVYTALMQLEREGMLTSAWGLDKPSERGYHRRRYYRLTGAGQLALTLTEEAETTVVNAPLGTAADLALDRGECPDCAAADLRSGPRGGIGMNVACAQCGAEFSVAPVHGMTFRVSPRGKPNRQRLQTIYGIKLAYDAKEVNNGGEG